MTARLDEVPPPARPAIRIWLAHHDRLLPGFVRGVYLVGSIALDDWRPGSDVDVVAVSDRPATDDQVEALRAAAAATERDVADVDVDGPFVTWDDLATGPDPVVRPWTLGREFHHDADCFELNPAVWTTLASHGVAVRGPKIAALDIAVDPAALRRFVRDNTAGYWASVCGAVESALRDPDRREFDASVTSWCVLGIARMLYTARTGSITSKSGAGRWLAAELPEHRDLIEHALDVRHSEQSPPDDRAIAGAVVPYMRQVGALVDDATSDERPR